MSCIFISLFFIIFKAILNKLIPSEASSRVMNYISIFLFCFCRTLVYSISYVFNSYISIIERIVFSKRNLELVLRHSLSLATYVKIMIGKIYTYDQSYAFLSAMTFELCQLTHIAI